jgi:hypothetical protein
LNLPPLRFHGHAQEQRKQKWQKEAHDAHFSRARCFCGYRGWELCSG